MIRFKHRGNFNKLQKFFFRMTNRDYLTILSEYGRKGVEALASSTPVDTGKTADSWEYTIETSSNRTTISWSNSNENQGYNIALMLQYGHGTKNGGYVKGIDYINPAIKPIFEAMASELWKEVTRS